MKQRKQNQLNNFT